MPGLYQEFLSQLKKTGLSKASHFEFFLPTVPTIITKDYLSQYPQVLRYRCETTELPGRQIVTQDAKIYGPTYKVPYQSLYQELSLTFIETGTLFIREFFESWHNQIFNSDTNQLEYPDTYQAEPSIIQYDMTAASTANNAPLTEIMTWKLHKAFPIAVNQMPVSWTDEGFHRTTVTLTYQYYSLYKLGANILTRPPSDDVLGDTNNGDF